MVLAFRDVFLHRLVLWHAWVPVMCDIHLNLHFDDLIQDLVVLLLGPATIGFEACGVSCIA